jgi:hypothetical protein
MHRFITETYGNPQAAGRRREGEPREMREGGGERGVVA